MDEIARKRGSGPRYVAADLTASAWIQICSSLIPTA